MEARIIRVDTRSWATLDEALTAMQSFVPEGKADAVVEEQDVATSLMWTLAKLVCVDTIFVMKAVSRGCFRIMLSAQHRG